MLLVLRAGHHQVRRGTRAPPHHAARHTTTTVCGDAPAGTSYITMTLCITLSISLLIHAVLIILPSSFTSLHHEGDVLAGTAAPPHDAARHTTTTVCGDATAGNHYTQYW